MGHELHRPTAGYVQQHCKDEGEHNSGDIHADLQGAGRIEVAVTAVNSMPDDRLRNKAEIY